MKKNIICSVGILTYNSEKTLRRTLESVKDFSNIIISDGGSTDATLGIAKEYECTVIEQYTKNHPGSNPDHPVDDFARERNLMLDVATEDWFLWLDSDEYISHELHDEIEEICKREISEYCIYEIPIVHQNLEGTVTYKEWKQNYQIRFFNLTTSGRFQRKMHEKYIFDKEKYSVGRLSGAWYVPMNKHNFSKFKKIITYRFGVMVDSAPRRTFFQYINKAVYQTTKTSIAIIGRYLFSSFFFSWKEIVPFSSVRNSLYSQWFLFVKISKAYFFENGSK